MVTVEKKLLQRIYTQVTFPPASCLLSDCLCFAVYTVSVFVFQSFKVRECESEAQKLLK